jgi:AcrR family transcriptional regulator
MTRPRAAAAGVGKQTIYRWWPSKAAVVLDVWAPETRPRVEFPDTGDLVADLKTQIGHIVDLAHDPLVRPSFLAVLADAQRDERIAQQLLDRLFYPTIAACKDRLRVGQTAGQLSTDIDLDIAVDLLYGGYYHRLLPGIAPLTHDYVDAIVDAAFSGIGPEWFSDQ